ncbi:MAG: hypothetical protein L3J43_06385 [Sulfurovum sp.]|nr:hypothetical protein [Sulfurovum sp.]
MSQVIMLLLFPIGLYFYFAYELKSMPAYQKTFDAFEQKIREDSTLSNDEKQKLYTQMLEKNGYTIVKRSTSGVKGQKRIFYMSLLAMGLGLYFVGAVVYLIYFFFFQKPHVVEFKV